jgi:hypothetical protein
MRKLSELTAAENAALQKIAGSVRKTATHAVYVMNCEMILCAMPPQDFIYTGLLLLAAKEFYHDCNLERAAMQYREDASFENWCKANVSCQKTAAL